MSPSECHEYFVRACLAHDLGGVRSAIANGLSVDFVDREGRYALHYAASSKNIDAARLLINCGAEVDCVDRNGNTPLSDAIFYGDGDSSVAHFLLLNNADRNKLNNHGVSPMALAASISNYDYSELFR